MVGALDSGPAIQMDLVGRLLRMRPRLEIDALQIQAIVAVDDEVEVALEVGSADDLRVSRERPFPDIKPAPSPSGMTSADTNDATASKSCSV